MGVWGLVGFALLAVTALAVLRPARPELAVLGGVAAAAALLVSILPWLAEILRLLARVAGQAGLPSPYLAVVLRILGVAYAAGFAAEVARDAGEGALAAKVELGGKVLILATALPVLVGVLELVARLVG